MVGFKVNFWTIQIALVIGFRKPLHCRLVPAAVQPVHLADAALS